MNVSPPKRPHVSNRIVLKMWVVARLPVGLVAHGDTARWLAFHTDGQPPAAVAGTEGGYPSDLKLLSVRHDSSSTS
jgi:hypothetical protein